MFNCENIFDDIFSYKICCNNKTETRSIIIPAKKNNVYNTNYKIADKNHYTNNEAKKGIESLMNLQ